MENNQRNQRKRLNSLILLVAFTAVMLIVSTYAWFSTQKNVSISNLYGEVKVAEGLQISLDAKHWGNSIDLSELNMAQSGSNTTPDYKDPTGQYLDSDATFLAPAEGVVNVVPDEYLPVSTAGTDVTTSGKGTGAAVDTTFPDKLVMYAGNNTDTQKLDTVVEMKEEADSGYFAFDIFLQNTTNGNDPDTLYLDKTSSVTVDNSGTGLENTFRVAFALFTNTTDSTTANGVLAQDTIIGATVTNQTVDKVAIWEPNSDAHIQTILDTINPRITFSAADKTAYGLASATEFATNEEIPTYALTSGSVGVDYTNIYMWDTEDEDFEDGLVKQVTVQTPTTITDDQTELKDVDGNSFAIAANEYHRIRIYTWIEGQDPDCINVASFGGGLTLDLGFSKKGSDEASSSAASSVTP